MSLFTEILKSAIGATHSSGETETQSQTFIEWRVGNPAVHGWRRWFGKKIPTIRLGRSCRVLGGYGRKQEHKPRRIGQGIGQRPDCCCGSTGRYSRVSGCIRALTNFTQPWSIN